MATFRIDTPDGRSFEINGDRAPTEKEIMQMVGNNQPQFSPLTEEKIAQNKEIVEKMNPKGFVDKLAEFTVTNPVSRAVGFGLQGIANSSLNPAGYVARAAGVDTKPLTPQNAVERGTELASEYGFDAAALGGLGKIAQGAGYLGKGKGVASKVAQEVLAPENTTALLSRFVAPAAGGGIIEGATNPNGQFEKTLANVVGGGIVGGIEGGLRKTIKQTQGGLKSALADEEANAALSKGIRADKTKGVARQINKEAPAVYNELNAEMSQALDDATGSKLNIDRALDTQQQRYNDFISKNADFEVFGEKTPLKNFTEGLDQFQTNALGQAIEKGSQMSTHAKGTLGATHRAQEVLNDMIDASYDTSVIGKKKPTTETRELMKVKERLNQILEPSGVKPYDAGISKAKSLDYFKEQGYKFNPSETKFENLGLKTYRDKRAFLQGRLAKLQDNVLSDGGTNLATAIKKDENTLKRLMPKSKFETLMNKADKVEESFKRLKSIQGQADKEVLKDIERGGSPWRENIESKGSMVGRALDIATGWLGRGAKTNLANQYLNPETRFISNRGGLLGALKGASAADTRQLMIDLLNGGN